MKEEKYNNKRVREIINSAMNIIGEKGYEKTTINDIINDVGIAKGTFYHYFKSKLELLDEIINFMWQDAMELSNKYMNNSSLNAIEKFNKLMEIGMGVKFQNIDFTIKLGTFLVQDENAVIFQKMKDKSYNMIMPYFKQIVSEGSEQGIFNVEEPEFTAEHLYSIFSHSGDKTKLMSDSTYQLRLVKNKQLTIEKLLGIPEGSLNLYDRWLEGIQKAKDFIK